MKDINAILISANLSEVESEAGRFLEQLTRLMKSDVAYYKSLLLLENHHSLYFKIYDSFKSRFFEMLRPQSALGDDMLDMMVGYVIAGIISVYRTWMINDCLLDETLLSRQLTAIVTDGINGILTRVG